MLAILRGPDQNISDRVVNWLNGTMLTVWRHNWNMHEQRVRWAEALLTPETDPVARNEAAMVLADLGAGGPLGMKVFPLLMDPSTAGYRGTLLYALLQTIGQWEPNWRRSTWDSERKVSIPEPGSPDRMAILKQLSESDSFEVKTFAIQILTGLKEHEAAGKNCWFQKGNPRSPTPPQIPGDEIMVYLPAQEGQGWVYVDPNKTVNLPVPPDPIRVDGDKFFHQIFEAVGLLDLPHKEIPNRYHADTYNREPWYMFPINGFELVVGPRKRVISITLRRDTPFDPSTLRDVAKRDAVTYTADDHWQSETTSTKEVNIHAWGAEKAVEYLQLVRALVE